MSTTQVSGTIPDTDRIEDLPEDGAAAPSALDTAELGKILLGRWPEARLAARKRADLEHCPNCGGELLDRPARTGKSLREHPAATERRHRG